MIYCVVVLLICDGGTRNLKIKDNLQPVYVWMGLVITGMIMAHALIHCLFGCNSLWVLLIISGVGAFEYVWHLKDFTPKK